MIYLIPLTSTVILSTGFSGILIFQYQDTHQLNLTTTSLSITWHQGKIFSGSITNAPRLQQFCILSSSWWRKNMTYFPSNHLSLVKRHCSSNKRRERWFSLLEFHRSHCRLAVVNFGTIIQGQQKTDNSGRGGIYVLRDSEFLSKSIVFTVCEHKYMNMPPLPNYRSSPVLSRTAMSMNKSNTYYIYACLYRFVECRAECRFESRVYFTV